MISSFDIEQAYQNIESDILKTPLVYSPKLSAISKARIYFKMEHLQHTGSFKIRGVLNKMKRFNSQEFKKTFIAASTGNHAAAFAFAQEKYGFKGVLFVPKNINKTKLKVIEDLAVETRIFGNGSVDAEKEARRIAQDIDGVLIHPYNDLDIIKGQGTIGVEIKEQLPSVDTILVPVGGGGLASGISSYFADQTHINVIGCQPHNASEMYASINEGKIVAPSTLKTIADGAAGGIEEHAITYEICKKMLSSFEIVSEEQIKQAVAFMLKFHNEVIEPTAAIPIASLLNSQEYQGKNVVLILTGSKIDAQLLTEIKTRYGNDY